MTGKEVRRYISAEKFTEKTLECASSHKGSHVTSVGTQYKSGELFHVGFIENEAGATSRVEIPYFIAES